MLLIMPTHRADPQQRFLRQARLLAQEIRTARGELAAVSAKYVEASKETQAVVATKKDEGDDA